MGSSSECVGVAQGITLVKFLKRFLGNNAILLVRLNSGHIVIFLCNKGLSPEIIIFCLYSN